MSRTVYIISIASLIALSGIVAFWSSLPSRFIGNPIGPTSVMEIPMQPSACDVEALEAVSGSTSPKGENLPEPGHMPRGLGKRLGCPCLQLRAIVWSGIVHPYRFWWQEWCIGDRYSHYRTFCDFFPKATGSM